MNSRETPTPGEPTPGLPDTRISVRKAFGIDSDMEAPAYAVAEEHVPDLDPDYLFDRETTLAILAGFAYNRRVMITGYHGTGKSTHIEQVAARLKWPCVRINLDSHVSRIDLVGKDAIVLKDGKQVTEFRDGMLPWALQNNIALCFDEYDAGRPDVMFVIQRVLEVSGKLTLLDQRRVIRPHPAFRLFATANTVGLGDTSGLYHGTQQINQGQMDRWSIVATLNYLPHDKEVDIVLAKSPAHQGAQGRPRRHQQDGAGGRPDPQRLRQRRPVDGDEPAHRDHLGGERRHLQGRRLRLPPHLPQQVRRTRAHAGRRVLPALLRPGPAGERAERRAELTAGARRAVQIQSSESRIAAIRRSGQFHAERPVSLTRLRLRRNRSRNPQLDPDTCASSRFPAAFAKARPTRPPSRRSRVSRPRMSGCSSTRASASCRRSIRTTTSRIKPKPEPVEALRAIVGACDAVVIAAPEYAHGVPGVLKNALDWLVASETFAGRKVVLINASPRAYHAQANLREILATMSARFLADAFVNLPLTGKAITAEEIAADPTCARRLGHVLEALTAAVAGAVSLRPLRPGALSA